MVHFTFDAPTSFTNSAYDKTHRKETVQAVLPSTRRKKSIVGPLSNIIQNPFRRSRASFPLPVSVTKLASESLLFRLPLSIRRKIYGYVVGQNELFHILMKHKSFGSPNAISYRRCRAGGQREDCIMEKCREYLNIENGSYFGKFDRIGGVLLTSRDIYMEATTILYSQNSFDFDHPLSLLILSRTISKSSLNSIKSITIELQRQLYSPTYAFDADLWRQMCSIIASIQGLQDLRIRFRSSVRDVEKNILEPLLMMTKQLSVFEIEAPWNSASVEFLAGESWKQRHFSLKDSTTC